ncbi:MAG: aminomethyl-transferring glycine dehydrogenase [Acetobacteraceae bacterium]
MSQRDPLWPASTAAPFIDRHVGPRTRDIDAMLHTLGLDSLDALIDATIPAEILDREGANQSERRIGDALSEAEALTKLRGMAQQNIVMRTMIGQGYYDTLMPAVIQRNIFENPAWYTAYTPYQPEISQGRLEALITFQTMVKDLTGLDIANASLLDEATACAEAMTMSHRVSRVKGDVFFVDADTHPQIISVLETHAAPLGWQIVVGKPEDAASRDDIFGLLLSYPGSSGAVQDDRDLIAHLRDRDVIITMTTDPLALLLLKPPGEMGADIAVGSMQRYGVPMGFGGPHAAFMAVRESFKRHMPGRLIGVSRDSAGRPAYRLALQTREQHIRREKATSNICTAQVLLAVIAAMYAVYHGPEGLRAIAKRVHRLASILAAGLRKLGVPPVSDDFFDTLTVSVGNDADVILKRAEAKGINLRNASGGRIGISCDEVTSAEDIKTLWQVFAPGADIDALEAEITVPQACFPTVLQREGALLTHPVFHQYRSETEMMRYLRRLADRDLALDRTMIPLGSCTMKLNAATEMMPVSWPEFATIHPHAPAHQVKGYHTLFAYLEQVLCRVTGYDAVSLQPNSGAQGEYAGLLAIRAYHQAQGEAERDICLIPASAHGTNPASAHLAGMRVVVVACDAQGNVDLDDLKVKLAAHKNAVAAMMITYPSTHGVFEDHIVALCCLVHAEGGQIYLDGANMNAQLGLAYPSLFGADVSHLNLHKTFCIPHGGGGPGMGPIGVKAHLASYLPGQPEKGGAHAVSAAMYGSASILPISTAYLMMTGDAGLRRATELAVLNANYVAHRLEPYFPVLYRGRQGYTAHECIIDLRPIKDETGVTVDDIAKRLIDYGFHAPTISFPVPGTFMIEPTESESLAELDRFCDAMIAIRAEIAEIARGDMALPESPLRHAPHTLHDLTSNWQRAYTCAQGCSPMGESAADKYFPPVNRIDNAWGDRNLVCACPDPSAYEDVPATD